MKYYKIVRSSAVLTITLNLFYFASDDRHLITFYILFLLNCQKEAKPPGCEESAAADGSAGHDGSDSHSFRTKK